ncbi:D-erythronate dehydrogenase [Methylocapsa sp. S129]|uniref:D-erythronate dehydrogenase n=1 Tax=Methylocapsa sp. S129 TaxID=1641869 RepID=UPI00131C9CA3|nr:D-erythronate dehydrogenase [Methylocapsa sp. S129]
MKILIVGAAGMIGRKLVERLAKDGVIGGVKITHADLVDIVEPAAPQGAPFATTTAAVDIAASYVAPKLIAGEPDAIFLLASIVSGEAESDFEKGYAINLDGTRGIFEAIRQRHLRTNGQYRPRVLFTSSIAVFGAPFPSVIDDEYFSTPLTSYGTQKAISELLLSDFSRRGFFDGVGIRLPTICVRPGKPNLAASGFFSNIIREPLAGQHAVLPVSEDVRHWHASPRSAVGFLIHAASLDTSRLGPRRNLTMPGVSVTVGEQIEALRKVAGEAAVSRIRREPNETIARIVAGWPSNFNAKRALGLGFNVEASFEDIIRNHIEEEHGGRIG